MRNSYKLASLVMFLFILVLSGCSNGINEFEKDYPMFKDIDHVYVKADYEEVYNALTKEEGYNVIVFAYDPDLYVCPYCMEVLPILNEVALEEGIEKILYLDIRTMRVERTEEYVNLIDYIYSQVDDLEMRNDKLEIIVPDLYVVKDGKILGHHIATLKDGEGKFMLNLSDEETNELKTIYKNLFNLKS